MVYEYSKKLNPLDKTYNIIKDKSSKVVDTALDFYHDRPKKEGYLTIKGLETRIRFQNIYKPFEDLYHRLNAYQAMIVSCALTPCTNGALALAYKLKYDKILRNIEILKMHKDTPKNILDQTKLKTKNYLKESYNTLKKPKQPYKGYKPQIHNI